MKKFSNIDEIKKHLSEAEQKLRADELLSEAECFQLKKDILNLSEEENGNAQEEDTMEIDGLVAGFKEYADKSKACLENMLGVIVKGCVPTKNECEEFNSVVAILNQKYNDVYAMAKEQLSIEEMPEAGSPVTDYADAVKNSKTATLKKKLKEIQNILQRFISVKAMADAYSKILASYQKDAGALLAKITGNEANVIEEIQEQVKGPELFLRTMECENMDSDEALDLLDQLGTLGYPTRIITGLSRKMFFLGDNSEDAAGDTFASTKEEKTENVEKIIVPDKTEKRELIPEKESAFGKDEEREDLPEKKDVSEQREAQKEEEALTSEQEVQQEEEKQEVTEFSKRIKKKDLFLKEEKDFGILSSDISTAEGKKLSASVFLNDLRKGNLKANTNIIKLLDKYPVISSEMLEMKYNMPANIAGIGLEFLKTKGYLRKYTLLSNGHFYCTSPRLEKALTYKDASKQVGVKQRFAANFPEFIEDKASSASARLALLNLITIHMKNAQARAGEDTSSAEYVLSNFLDTSTFIYQIVPSDKPEECELFTGVFWTDDKECDGYITALKKKIAGIKTITKFVIASVNYRFAKKIADEIVREIAEEVKNVPIYVYALNGDEFYEFYGNKKIVLEDIWPSLKQKDSVQEDGTDEILAVAESKTENPEEIVPDTAESDFGIEKQITEKSKNIKNDMAVLPVVETGKAQNQVEEITEILCKFINAKKSYCASPYVKARMAKDESLADFYEQVAFAFNDPMRNCIYSANDVYEIISFKESALSEYMNIAIALRTFFSNQVQYEYNPQALSTIINESEILSSYPNLSTVLYKLEQFKASQKKGMDAYADYHVKSIKQLEEILGKIQKEADNFYESTIKGKKKEDKSQLRFLETKKLIFSPNGELGKYIEVAVKDDRAQQPDVESFLRKYFIREGNVISEETIDEEMLWEYIVGFWEKAGDKMTLVRRSSDLMGQLRNNITNATKKGIQILAKWFVVVDKLNNKQEDSGTLAYKKQRKPLLDVIEEAFAELFVASEDETADEIKKAGLEIIRCALDEINRCISGTYEERERRFVYAPFLLTNHIMLDENFNPDLRVFSAELEELQPEYRILEHASAECAKETDRLSEILEHGEDNYGTARLLVEYMEAMDSKEDINTYKENIESGEGYARETASLKKDQFIGDLELAQSYGQIESSNSREDKKEKMLQVVNEWYEAVLANSNYGFFGHVTESYLANIKKESKHREKDLLEQVKKFRESSINGLSEGIKEARTKKILAAINQQNYTVAEDLLAHAEQLEGDSDNPIEENFLKDFLDDYNDYYRVVSQSNVSLVTLISKNAHNKESKGGKKLAESWLPGGSALGKMRLLDLLSGLGFRVNQGSVSEQEKTGKFENYYVKTIPAKGGKRENYMHPIAAFGSGASQEGFRVVCLNGKYDAATLIDVMKQIGNSRHTMILLDSAMDITQRRTLARKTRQELGDKVFVVIDRTVMMYLVKNYDEMKVNRMLISLIMPFGYYQPYIWESAQVMPPEIFMGRKRELEQIESATGVNIVYGGRQLGKSALLKMAKSDIDFDEYGDRAVLIDIKGLDYNEVAKKIGNELYDAGVLAEDINTTDWSQLVRTIKKRLLSEDNRIPYLLLLLDEADAFIESCKPVGYRPFDALKELQGIGSGRFKFVVAGLRNVVRFQKEAALGNNSVLTHLESMTVKPFRPAEARELMEIPLHYLGLEFPKENENLTGLILASTNYFPGLIQMYCAKLLSAMRNKDYAGYAEADTPIFEVGEEHIRKVLADPEFMEQIREKFFITLKLDEDNYYYLIALLMAYLYYANGYNEGYSAEDIKEAGKDLGIGKIAGLEMEKLEAFMEELKELNVFRRTTERHYLFTRYTFFQMMGTRLEVDDKLVAYMEG